LRLKNKDKIITFKYIEVRKEAPRKYKIVLQGSSGLNKWAMWVSLSTLYFEMDFSASKSILFGKLVSKWTKDVQVYRNVRKKSWGNKSMKIFFLSLLFSLHFPSLLFKYWFVEYTFEIL